MKSLAAEGITNPALEGGPLESMEGLEFFSNLLPRLVGLAFVVGTIIFVFIMLMGAIQWIISGGDKSAIEQAKGKITNAVIGIIILFATFAVLKLVEDFFGVNILELNLAGIIIE